MRHRVERKIPFVLIDVEVGESIGLAKGAAYAGDGTIHSRLAVAFEHDIDDPMVALGIIFRGGIGHDLDALDLIGGVLVPLEPRFVVLESDGRGSVAGGCSPAGGDGFRSVPWRGVRRGVS